MCLTRVPLSRSRSTVSSVIAASVREIDIVARYGGDEITVLLPQMDTEGALVVAHRILGAVRHTPVIKAGKKEIRMSVTIGVASAEQGKHDPVSLVRRADKALILTKKKGRGGIGKAL